MSLKNVKIGDEVVSFPFGLGKVEFINCNWPYPIRIEFNSRSCEYVTIGGALYDGQPTSCWPINDAPEWFWGALGIEKPKKKVMKTLTVFGNIYEKYDVCTHLSKELAHSNSRQNAIAVAVKFTSEPFEVEGD